MFVNVGSLCIAAAFLGVVLSLLKMRRDDKDQVSLAMRIMPLGAGLGALLVVGAMVVPGSPAMMPWPIEWIVLGIVALIGVAFWFGAAGIRQSLSETARQRLILNEMSEKPE